MNIYLRTENAEQALDALVEWAMKCKSDYDQRSGRYIQCGNYTLWVAPTDDVEYVEVFLTRNAEYTYYVDLGKGFSFIDFRYPPPPVKVKPKKNKWGVVQEDEVEEVFDSRDMMIYRKEYPRYEQRKQLNQPTWYLHMEKVQQLIDHLSEEGT